MSGAIFHSVTFPLVQTLQSRSKFVITNHLGHHFKGILDISVPGHFGTDLDISVLGTGHFGTDLDISVLGTGQLGTWSWMRQYSVLMIY